MEKKITVSIDRVGIVVPLCTTYDLSQLRTTLWSNAGAPGVKIKSAEYRTTASLPLAPGQSLVVTAGMAQKFCYGKYDFKPADLTGEGWARLCFELSQLLDFGYASVLVNGYVNYLEIAADFNSVVAKGLFPYDGKIRKSNWYPSYFDPTPTAYLGTSQSTRRIRMYDRVARLKKLGIEIEGPVTRLEAVLRNLKCSIADLEKIANPFLPCGVCRFADAESWSDEKSWKIFLKYCKEWGTAYALAMIGPIRKKYLGYLMQLCCEWWNPDEIWSMYPKALDALLPPPHVHMY